ncbi:uncharacterized protein BDZ99DRAFT_465347 [Mytilinidion resinicola]|uniref:Uncharacterized protein n=1 Tax=Mytilinidion resinicola TaxID=574789 RepID=A0A6A6YHK3_9PEZI|nr:uncharacterized protein BDZ99DRAFT_465347 [Mytilinidion resinicola]KAF2807484.1 hypothetical protein BDZ99DRAFT_465347 [Mytilinidion resinicola]
MELEKLSILSRLSFILVCIALKVHADDEYKAYAVASVWAVLNCVLWRYVLSSVVYRLILVVGIGG